MSLSVRSDKLLMEISTRPRDLRRAAWDASVSKSCTVRVALRMTKVGWFDIGLFAVPLKWHSRWESSGPSGCGTLVPLRIHLRSNVPDPAYVCGLRQSGRHHSAFNGPP